MKKYFIQLAKEIKLLYVEDDKSSREETSSILKSVFAEVLVAKDGLEGLEIFKKHHNNIDLIITDIQMPNLSGLDMIEEIKKIDKKINILIISSHEDVGYLKKAISLSVDGYLQKPINFSELFKEVVHILNNIKENKKVLDYQSTLENTVTKQKTELLCKDEILEAQSRMAIMGEMIDIIAHQWQQPLNIISMRVSYLAEFSSLKTISYSEIYECYEKVKEQILHLVDTLSQFREFFRVDDYTDLIEVDNLFSSIFVLIHDELVKNNISIKKEFERDLKFPGNLNEIKHLYINLINNSKDAFSSNKIKNRQLSIKACKNKENICITFRDNAGGISNEIINNIFDLNFTTKKEQGGTGVGLYLCKLIAEKHNASLEVKSLDDTTEFILNIPAYK